ncbi:MAG TPA: type II toxin-antitoxin system VapC family toxin [Gemmataceae bacterium]
MAKKKKAPRSKKLKSVVLDGSTALAWCFTDENSAYADAVARSLPRIGALVPAVWHLEVANALVVGERRGRCDRDDTLKWTKFLLSLPISIEEHSGSRIFHEVADLARAQKLSTYDAAYLELALRRGLPLATLDEPLKHAAVAVGIELFDPSR